MTVYNYSLTANPPTVGRNTKKSKIRPHGRKQAFPVAASVAIPGQCLVMLSGGYVTNAAAGATPAAALLTPILGCSRRDVDNTADSSGGAQYLEIDTDASWFVNGDSIARADVGYPCYATDNQTVSKSSNGGVRPYVGVICDVDTTFGVLVDFDGTESAAFLGAPHAPVWTESFPVAADANAAATLAETIIGSFRRAGKIVSVKFHPTGAVSTDATNIATVAIAQRDGAGGASQAVASWTSNSTGGSALVAFTAKDFGTITNPTIIAGGDLTITKTKGGTGQTLPAGTIVVTLVPTNG